MRGKNEEQAQQARLLRVALTPAETKFSRRVRGRQLGGFKFVRQEPIGPYYIDFACRDRRLIVELDGGQHAGSLADRQRDNHLAGLGYRVRRVWNNEMLDNLDGVLQTVLSALRE